MSDIADQIEINRLTAEVERLQKLVVETSVVAGAAVGSAEVLGDAVTQYRQDAEDLAEEVECLKHDIARHVQIATDLNSEVERLKGVLGWYADENNWRDQSILRMDRLGRECEDQAPAEIYDDYGSRARSALEAKP